MKNEQIISLVRKVLEEEKRQRIKALQKEKDIQMQMCKDLITTIIAIAILSVIPFSIIMLGGFTFLTGIIVTIFAVLMVIMIYLTVKEDNETRETRVKRHKQECE
jgi:Ca2+/Na+ antiporter